MAKQIQSIGLIGGGNMGEAFAGAIIRSGLCDPSMISISDVNAERLDSLRATYGVNVTQDNARLFSQADIVILAVKPQIMSDAVSSTFSAETFSLKKRKLVISIAAGIPIRRLEALLYADLDEVSRKNLPIIRVMPNTPALVLEGMSGMCANRYALSDDIGIARKILESMGSVLEFDEAELDAVTALSGSGPAYVFYIVESMVEAGIRQGLKPDDAFQLTLGTLKGAVRMLEERDESPDILRKKVTSPGGTTEAALNVMENYDVKQTVIEAIAAAAERSKELSEQ